MWARKIASIFGYVVVAKCRNELDEVLNWTYTGSLFVKYFNNFNGVKYAHQHFHPFFIRRISFGPSSYGVYKSNTTSVKKQ